jgi:hypothetical protein
MMMDWKLVFWTALSWMFSGGILYLVYHFGYNTALERGVRWRSWRTVILLLGFAVSLALFGTGYPDEGYGRMPTMKTDFSPEEVSRFLGVFIIIVATYTAGFVDGKFKVRT